MLKALKNELIEIADPDKAKVLSRFFKTGKGEYGEGDVFLGIPVPEQRRIAEKYQGLTVSDIKKLLSSTTHEHRLVALLILIIQYRKESPDGKKRLCDFYLNNRAQVNNWDLVDLSAHHILGDYLLDKDRAVLYQLAASDNVWERRIAIMSTFAFIRKNQFEDTFNIASLLLRDTHDLIHKAAGWMLREIGKKNQAAEEEFLLKYFKEMPRTMLRYAIERFEDEKREFYLRR
jgi:3-methyladenine DNA glycosylase AlkD